MFQKISILSLLLCSLLNAAVNTNLNNTTENNVTNPLNIPTPIYQAPPSFPQATDNAIVLTTGWNLITPYNNTYISVKELKEKDVNKIFGFKDGKYYEPTTLEVGYGYWIYYDKKTKHLGDEISIKFYDSNVGIHSYKDILANVKSSGWNLLGYSSKNDDAILVQDLLDNNIEKVYAFEPITQVYRTNVKSLFGEGFWVYRK